MCSGSTSAQTYVDEVRVETLSNHGWKNKRECTLKCMVWIYRLKPSCRWVCWLFLYCIHDFAQRLHGESKMIHNAEIYNEDRKKNMNDIAQKMHKRCHSLHRMSLCGTSTIRKRSYCCHCTKCVFFSRPNEWPAGKNEREWGKKAEIEHCKRFPPLGPYSNNNLLFGWLDAIFWMFFGCSIHHMYLANIATDCANRKHTQMCEKSKKSHART